MREIGVKVANVRVIVVNRDTADIGLHSGPLPTRVSFLLRETSEQFASDTSRRAERQVNEILAFRRHLGQ